MCPTHHSATARTFGRALPADSGDGPTIGAGGTRLPQICGGQQSTPRFLGPVPKEFSENAKALFDQHPREPHNC